MKSIKITTLLLVIVLAFGCDKDDSPSNNPTGQDPNTFVENFGNEITRNFLGTVIDKDKNPIENVTITIGSLNALTDSNGVFIIQDAPIYERFGYVKAEKAGYISGSRAVVPSSGTNKVTIMLLDETVVGTTSSGTAETISLTNGASVALAGDYITEDGSAYSGTVNVIMHHLDPTDENMEDQMPGMLYAANANNEEQMLKTFGMLAVELQGSAGEKLNLAEGTTAEITVPLDATLLADAPSGIPLWYFDETHGYWVEEGEATLVGNAYVGTVSHFSFWNCDVLIDAVNLCVTVTDVNGAPLANLWVTISSTVYGTRGGNTNENGEVCGLIPANEILSLEFYEYSTCGITPFFTMSIGPYTEDTSIELTIPDSGDLINETIIVGFFETCDGNPVTDGYINLYNEAGTLISTELINDGNFELSTLRCTSDSNIFKLKGVDYSNAQDTGQISFTYSSPITNVGTISACNAIQEFIYFNIDDSAEEVTIYENIYAGYNPDPGPDSAHLSISGGADLINCFYLTATTNNIPIDTYTYPNFQITGCMDISSINNHIIHNLTALGEVGEYIDINFSGDYEDLSGNPHFITGVIHVLRDR